MTPITAGGTLNNVTAAKPERHCDLVDDDTADAVVLLAAIVLLCLIAALSFVLLTGWTYP